MGWRNRVSGLLLSGGVVVWAQAAQPTSPARDEAAAQTLTSCVQPPPLVGGRIMTALWLNWWAHSGGS
jgi:hypothetical protein